MIIAERNRKNRRVNILYFHSNFYFFFVVDQLIENYPCKFCQLSFKTSDLLDYHMKQFHTDEYIEKNNTCNDCGKAFSQPYVLEYHYKREGLNLFQYLQKLIMA